MGIYTLAKNPHKWECIAPEGYYYFHCLQCGETAPYPALKGEKHTECSKHPTTGTHHAREDTKMGIREEHAEIHATVCNRLGQRKFKRFAYVPVGSEFRVGPCGSVTFKKLNEDEAIRVDGNGYRTKFELDARCTYPWPPTAGEPMVTCPQCEGTPDLCNGYCEGNGMVTTNHAAEWRRQNREPQAGKTLADFANSGKLFKRPMHANPHGFTAGSDYLREIRTSNWQGQHNVIADFPRLTREDLTATDWQEVTGEV